MNGHTYCHYSAQYPGPKGPATPSGVASGHCYDQHVCEIITLWQLYSYPVQVLARAEKCAVNPSELAAVGCWFRLSSKTAYIFHLFIY